MLNVRTPLDFTSMLPSYSVCHSCVVGGQSTNELDPAAELAHNPLNTFYIFAKYHKLFN